MKLLLDTNILLDIVLKRQPFMLQAAQVLKDKTEEFWRMT